MITVQGPTWALGIAAFLVLLMEICVRVREGARDLRFRSANRRDRLWVLRPGWKSGEGERLIKALAKQRPGR